MSLSQIPAACLLVAVLTAPARAEDRKEIVIGAAELATAAQRADKPTPGKWWLNRDSRDGTILMTGRPLAGPPKTGEWVVPPAHLFVPYRVPALVVDPKATGWYRLHVGLYQDTRDPWIRPQLFARLSDEPYPEYLRAPQHTKGRVA